MNSYMWADNLAVNCPYHDHWVRIGEIYRTCPAPDCKYCVRCKALGRPIFSKHTHGKYKFTDAELEAVTL